MAEIEELPGALLLPRVLEYIRQLGRRDSRVIVPIGLRWPRREQGRVESPPRSGIVAPAQIGDHDWQVHPVLPRLPCLPLEIVGVAALQAEYRCDLLGPPVFVVLQCASKPSSSLSVVAELGIQQAQYCRVPRVARIEARRL